MIYSRGKPSTCVQGHPREMSENTRAPPTFLASSRSFIILPSNVFPAVTSTGIHSQHPIRGLREGKQSTDPPPTPIESPARRSKQATSTQELHEGMVAITTAASSARSSSSSHPFDHNSHTVGTLADSSISVAHINVLSWKTKTIVYNRSHEQSVLDSSACTSALNLQRRSFPGPNGKPI